MARVFSFNLNYRLRVSRTTSRTTSTVLCSQQSIWMRAESFHFRLWLSRFRFDIYVVCLCIMQVYWGLRLWARFIIECTVQYCN